MGQRLGPLEETVLMVLMWHRGWSSREIADEMQRREWEINRVLLRLEEKGYIDGGNNPTGRHKQLESNNAD